MFKENTVTVSHEGELIFTLSEPYNIQFKLSSWLNGLNFLRLEQNEWNLEKIDAGIILVPRESIDYESNDNAVVNFVKNIPLALRQTISVYHYKQFSLLHLAAQSRELHEVILHSPNLSWMLVVYASNNDWSMEQTILAFQLKRIKIIEIIFGIHSSMLVKLINKIKFINGSEGEYLLTIKLFKKRYIVETFKHWQVVPIQALRVINRYRCFLNSNLLFNEVDIDKSVFANLKIFSGFHRILADIHRVNASLNKPFDLSIQYTVKTGRELTQFNNRLTPELQRTRELIRELAILQSIDENYPQSPIGDLEHFVQIKNRNELLKEGIYMSHCVINYHYKLKIGKRYIYKLLYPQRATVEIYIGNNYYEIKQFRLAKNEIPHSDSLKYLIEILKPLNKTNLNIT
ncbi:hypothetical protein [Psychromonas arctica]|uniref:hypothetical protein n=1 Tax=Psychromonas arctica TaxID=168275 RepID=UPI002FD011CD